MSLAATNFSRMCSVIVGPSLSLRRRPPHLTPALPSLCQNDQTPQARKCHLPTFAGASPGLAGIPSRLVSAMQAWLDAKPKPNLAKPSKIQPSRNKGNQRKSAGFPWFPLSILSLFSGLRRPPRHKILFWLPARRAPRAGRGSSGDEGRIAWICFPKRKSRLPRSSRPRSRAGAGRELGRSAGAHDCVFFATI